MMGSGKSTVASRLAPQYDAVFGTDIREFRQGEWINPDRATKERLRLARRKQIVDLHLAGRRVLVEGVPQGVLRLLGEDLRYANNVYLISVTPEVGLARVAQRARRRGSDPEQDVMDAREYLQDYDSTLRAIEHAVGKPLRELSP